MIPCKLQFAHVLKTDDEPKRKKFCVDMQEKREEDDFEERLAVSDESTDSSMLMFTFEAKKIPMIYSVSLAMRTLKTYKIVHEIHLYLNFSFKI